MISTTRAFQEAIVGSPRRVMGRITVDYSDPFLDPTVTLSANEQGNAPALLVQASDGRAHPHRRWASCDGTTLANGWSSPAPTLRTDGHMGWWGRQLAGVGGSFSPPFPTLRVGFSSRLVKRIRVVGDSLRVEWPTDFSVSLLGAGNVVLFSHVVVGNMVLDWILHITPIVGVIQIVVEIHRWSHAGRQAKLLEVQTVLQETYEGDDIVSIDLLEEREFAQGSLPVGNVSANEIAIKLDNSTRHFDASNRSSPLYQLLLPNRRIRAWLAVEGGEDYLPLGTFWSGDWHTSSETLYATTTGQDRLGQLRKTNYSTSRVVANQSLYALATTVLLDAGLMSTDFWVDPALQHIVVPNAWFGVVSHREALREIAEASLGQVFADREGVVRVEGVAHLLEQETFVSALMVSTQSLTLTPDLYFRKDTPTRWDELTNHVEVETQPLRVETALQEVFRSSEPVSIVAGETLTLTVRYNETPVVDAVAHLEAAPAGKTITEAHYYAWGAVITISSTVTGTFRLVIQGRPLKVLNRERAIAADETSIRESSRLRYTYPHNHLVQTLSRAQTVANTLLRLYRHPRRDLTMDWRGNPALMLGDMVITKEHEDWLRYWVIRQELNYDGALSARLEGRLAR